MLADHNQFIVQNKLLPVAVSFFAQANALSLRFVKQEVVKPYRG
jgi:hypothetical protein